MTRSTNDGGSAVKVETQRMPEVGGETTRAAATFRPDVDIVENEHEILLLADLPGVRSEDIEIQFERGMLTLHARVEQRQAQEVRWLAREYAVGDFRRSFQVSETIDGSRISAETKDGVLVLHLPKQEAVKPRRIEVKARD